MKKGISIAMGLLLAVSLVTAYGLYGYGFMGLVQNSDKDYINLCYKEAPTWECQNNKVYGGLNKYMQGFVEHKTVSKDALDGRVIISGLKPNTEYQLKLNSFGAGFVADAFAKACATPNQGAIWQCGKWGTEGFVVIGTYTSNDKGELRTEITSPFLPEGVYRSKFLVTENQAPWTTPLMENAEMQFVIIN